MNWESLAPLLKPVLLELWKNVVLPELQKLESTIGSADLKLVSDAMVEALDKIAQAEIPKI